jgi:crotonobetainyl-CoA:carnitine CoA-transferase CaiB-like acyl-CoA transferase
MDDMKQPSGFLAGVRVLELADEMGEYCGRVLAGLGADVIKVEPIDGERTRSIGPFYRDESNPDRSLYFWQYNFGKRGICLDLESSEGQEQFRALVATADVVLDARTYSSLEAQGLGYDSLVKTNPSILYLRITPFGDDGPWADFKGSDLVHLALGGVMMNCGYDAQPNGTYDTPPIAPQMWQAYHIAGEMGVIAIIAALIYRLQEGVGQRLSLAVHEAVSKNTELDVPNWIYSRSPHTRQTCRHSIRAGDTVFNLPWITMTKDGRWLYPYRTYLERGTTGPDMLMTLRKFLEDNGMNVELDPEILAGDRDYRNRPEVKSHVNGLTDRFVGGFKYEREIWRDAQKVGLPWAPIRRPEENADEEHWWIRQTIGEVEHPELGESFTYVTGRWVSDEAPWRAGPRAPLTGEHTEQVLAELAAEAELPASPRTSDRPAQDRSEAVLSKHGKPFALAGVKVVDLSWMVASGGAGRFFTCMGADVVKVEHESRLDSVRLSYGRPPAGGREERRQIQEPADGEGGVNRSGFFMDMCAGKRSLSLNLKTDQGREILTKMIADADIIIEGFSPGTMDRMGFGYERLKEINPGIIYVQQSGLGQRGIYGSMKSYGPTAQAFSGLSEMSGMPEPYPPAGIGYSYLDWFGAYNMATAMMAALYRKRATGLGCYVDSSQVDLGIYLSGTAMLDHSVNGRRWSRRGNRAPQSDCAPHGAFPTSGTDRWIAIGCTNDDDWQALAKVLGLSELAQDPRFVDVSARIANQDELEAIIQNATSAWDGYELMNSLQAVGVTAGVCQTAEDRCDRDPQLEHLGWLVELTQQDIGTWPVKEFPVQFSETPAYMGGVHDRHGPSYGQDTVDVLHEMGLDDAQIEELSRSGVL